MSFWSTWATQVSRFLVHLAHQVHLDLIGSRYSCATYTYDFCHTHYNMWLVSPAHTHLSHLVFSVIKATRPPGPTKIFTETRVRWGNWKRAFNKATKTG